jgi:capsular polysaccharide biosynthesis protein
LQAQGFLPLVKKWGLLLALAAVVAGVAAFALASRSAPTYSAEVKLLVGPVSADYSLLRASGELGRTYAELSTSRPVIQAAAKKAGVQATPLELQESITASSNEITRIVAIAVQHSNAKTAADLANALGDRVRRITAATPAEDEEILSEFEAQVEVEALAPAARERVTEAARRTLALSSAGRLTVVDPAEPSIEPIAPNVKLITLFGAVAGLLLAGVLILVRETTSLGMASERSLAARETPAFIGAVDARAKIAAGELAAEQDGTNVAADYRTVATKIGFLEDDPPVRTLLVLDSGDGSSGAATAANLAAVLSRADRQVVLVDANASKRSATSLLGLEGQPGYGELLESIRHAPLNGQLEELKVARTERFEVVPSGSVADGGLLDVDRAQRLMDGFQSRADFVVVTAPPIHVSPSALVWARVAEGTVLVVDGGQTPQERLDEVVRSLSFVGANVIGTVLGKARGPLIKRR